jgi:hypothetical protein
VRIASKTEILYPPKLLAGRVGEEPHRARYFLTGIIRSRTDSPPVTVSFNRSTSR